MSENENKSGNKSPKGGPNRPDENFDWAKVIRLVFGWGTVIVAAVIIMQIFRTGVENFTEIPYGQYEILIEDPDNIISANITKADLNDYTFKATLKKKTDITINGKSVPITAFSVYIPEPLIVEQEKTWKDRKIHYSFSKESNEWVNILVGFLPWIFIIAIWVIIMRRMQGQSGGSRGIFSFGKSKAKLITPSSKRVTFKDVAGADEAKLE
ncbi:MAG TPA: cell division protein FtsH, partial [Ignavibacteriaceae bacterium]|nr:cell division protein FtsH [Ignavibacteriaceae bacterium]